jgi:hypothetical protein
MARRPGRRVAAWDRARLTIVFDLRADPVAPFAGWMELTRAIERALDTDRRADAEDSC